MYASLFIMGMAVVVIIIVATTSTEELDEDPN
jgi:hypothetical protein